MPGINLAIGKAALDSCLASLPIGWDIDTWLKTCFFIYDQNPDTCTIRIEDHSELITTYALTDTHVVFINILDEDGIIVYSGTMEPFKSFSFDLPGCGNYEVQINVEYTIIYDDGINPPITHVFQIAYIYPVECVRSGNYHNTLLAHIDCLITANQCEIQRRKCVGKDYCQLQEGIFALNNYRYALCNFDFCVEEFDQISCAVKQIKKAC